VTATAENAYLPSLTLWAKVGRSYYHRLSCFYPKYNQTGQRRAELLDYPSVFPDFVLQKTDSYVLSTQTTGYKTKKIKWIVAGIAEGVAMRVVAMTDMIKLPVPKFHRQANIIIELLYPFFVYMGRRE
jgi:hypothetical protein